MGTQIVAGKFDPENPSLESHSSFGTIILLAAVTYFTFGKWVIRLSHGEGTVFTGVGFLGWTRRFSYNRNSTVSMTYMTSVSANGQPQPGILVHTDDQDFIFVRRAAGQRQAVHRRGHCQDRWQRLANERISMSLFGWPKPKCPVGLREKAWVEMRLRWLGEQFGVERLARGEVIVPTEQYFPDDFDETPEAARVLLDRVCRFMGIPPSAVTLKFFRTRAGRQQKSSSSRRAIVPVA